MSSNPKALLNQFDRVLSNYDHNNKGKKPKQQQQQQQQNGFRDTSIITGQKYGLDDGTIEFIVQELSIMDSNNFPANVGVGEREGRVYSSLVARRHYGLSHGIGRSGDIAEQQPKAAGSSIIYKLTNTMTSHALELAGFRKPASALVLPMATGMTLAICMLTLRNKRMSTPTNDNNKDIPIYMIWSRIDQKSCFKSIITAGLIPLIVDHVLDASGQLQTDTAAIRNLLVLHGRQILGVLSTTSCFAPRQPDAIDEIAKLCKEFDVAHVINNAYGLQCPIITKLINRAVVVGHVDAVVQSTDKNFLVPVGGAIVNSPSPAFLQDVAKMYPGRANMSPIFDLFVTFLAMGEDGLVELWTERQRLLFILQQKLQRFAEVRGERLLLSPKNSISVGVTLVAIGTNHGTPGGSSSSSSGGGSGSSSNNGGSVVGGSSSVVDSISSNSHGGGSSNADRDSGNGDDGDGGNGGNGVDIDSSLALLAIEEPNKHVNNNNTIQQQSQHQRNVTATESFVGSMLFQRNVSGCRVVVPSSQITNIASFEFANWGAHTSHYPDIYFTAACSIGLTAKEIDTFLERLENVWSKYEKTHSSIPSHTGLTPPQKIGGDK